MNAAAAAQAPRPSPLQAAREDRLRRGLRAIKAAQRQLGMDDDSYRTMLAAQCAGKRSATELTMAEQAKVLDYLRRLGAVNPREAERQAARSGGRKRGTPAPDKAALRHKLNALLDELGRVTGEPHSLAYADAICKRNGWAERVDFCDSTSLRALVGAVARTLRAKAARPDARAPLDPAAR
ncbi:MAG: DUF1018 domain-containing protein [Burkholderiaceae bacterium]|nr:DUF1018 domain-containing protein [Burkholderiaceae bacterium]